MKGMCLIWSRGQHLSPSLPGDRYLKPSSLKRSPGRNLGEYRLARRSDTASRGTSLLEFFFPTIVQRVCILIQNFPGKCEFWQLKDITIILSFRPNFCEAKNIGSYHGNAYYAGWTWRILSYQPTRAHYHITWSIDLSRLRITLRSSCCENFHLSGKNIICASEYFRTNYHTAKEISLALFNNYSLRRSWIVVDIWRAVKRRGKIEFFSRNRKSVSKAREAYLVTKGNTLQS